MNVSLDHIRTFHAVVEHGSLLAASGHLGLTQPTVGRHIDLLEGALGFRLFVRGRGGMRLTGKGADLVATARDLVSDAVAFERLAGGMEEKIEGVVRLSANQIIGTFLLPGILGDFMRDYPEIEVETDVSNEATNLLQRDADIAIRMFRPRQGDLVARKITELPIGLFAHRDYLSRCTAPTELSDLRQHSLIGSDRDASLIDAYRAAGLALVPGDFAFRCDNDLAGINAVRAGIGIGPLHRGMAALWPGIVQVLSDLPIPPVELWLACHSDVRHNKRIRLMMDFLSERLRSPYAGCLS
ncbi:LysR family transcriptional regulator [uncultured Roseobacter sp.]|uniref:LysR family transcriptional regulator n=1 Tax=uncultured Roseobacter sp. TaxID=114847 RepID=UPI002615D3E6|nr:LysR family transcriptional regulator [uncultured Roseobacter sp.]